MTFRDRVIRLSGDDYRIVKHCDAGSQALFFLTGLFIPVVFIICCISSFITFQQVFDNLSAVIVLSLFFGWMITNLYRLLLYTFSRNPLPQVDKKIGKLLSRLLRLGFVCFIATMIAKPVESVIYANVLDQDIAAFKMQAKKNSHYKIAFYYQRQIDEIMHLSENNLFSKQFLQNKLGDRRQAILHANALIDTSGFFLQRLRFLCTYHNSCWWITAFFTLVFLYPLALKYHLRTCSYYQLKGACDKRKIDLNHYAFRKKYLMLFEKFYMQKITITECYEDPPYNTIRKQDKRRFLTENEFITELYHV